MHCGIDALFKDCKTVHMSSSGQKTSTNTSISLRYSNKVKMGEII